MRHSLRRRGALICLLILAALAGAALAAGQQGTQNDPLVTLSYLNDKARAEFLAQVDAKIAQNESALTEKLRQAAGGQGGSASFQVVTLTKGQQLTGKEGCEILLRSGSGLCVSSSAPGLIDMTSGTTLAGGGSLTANHLYLATVDGRGVRAASAVTLLVRGGYSVA